MTPPKQLLIPFQNSTDWRSQAISLPAPTVKLAHKKSLGALTEAERRAADYSIAELGLADHAQTMSDEDWCARAARLIEVEGPDQFLVNLLYVTRGVLGPRAPLEIIHIHNDEVWVYLQKLKMRAYDPQIWARRFVAQLRNNDE